METFPANSHKAREAPPSPPEEKKVESVVTGPVVQRKKSLGRRFKETFLGNATNSVFEYIALEVLVPALKDTLSEVITQTVERTLFGEVRSPARRGMSRPSGPSGYVQYNRPNPVAERYPRPEPRREVSRNARQAHDFDEIVLATRVEAETVLDKMYDLLSKYETVTLGDFYSLVDIASKFTDENYGWTDLRFADGRSPSVVRTRNGYIVDLPKPQPLD